MIPGYTNIGAWSPFTNIGAYQNPRLCNLVYRGQDGNIDYTDHVAVMSPSDSQVTIPSQALPANTRWHYVRRQVSDCALESVDSPICEVVIDSAGDMIPATPNPPLDLTIEQLSGGKLKLRWRYTKLAEEVEPTGFNIYMDSGSGFNFASSTATVSYDLGGLAEFSWTSGALTNGQLYRFCVRSYRTAGGETQNTDFVAALADSVGPAAITGLRATFQEI
jgi:hypothetical protein